MFFLFHCHLLHFYLHNRNSFPRPPCSSFTNALHFQMLIICSTKRLRRGSGLFDLCPAIYFHLSAFKCYFRFTLTYQHAWYSQACTFAMFCIKSTQILTKAGKVRLLDVNFSERLVIHCGRYSRDFSSPHASMFQEVLPGHPKARGCGPTHGAGRCWGNRNGPGHSPDLS